MKFMVWPLLCLVLFYRAFTEDVIYVLNNCEDEETSVLTGFILDYGMPAPQPIEQCYPHVCTTESYTSTTFTPDEKGIINLQCPTENQAFKSMEMYVSDNNLTAISLTCCTLKDNIVKGDSMNEKPIPDDPFPVAIFCFRGWITQTMLAPINYDPQNLLLWIRDTEMTCVKLS